MPTYAYRCTACGQDLEVHQSFDDDALTTCPECAGALRKVFSGVGVVFKGSGFYRTDSRSSSTATLKSANGSNGESSATKATETSAGSGDAGGSSSTNGSTGNGVASKPAASTGSSAPASTAATTS